MWFWSGERGLKEGHNSRYTDVDRVCEQGDSTVARRILTACGSRMEQRVAAVAKVAVAAAEAGRRGAVDKSG